MAVKNNHYVTRAFSENFRSIPGKPFYVLDCKTGSIQCKGLKTLFMKRHAWGDELERLFGDLENEVMPAIKRILGMPFPSFTEHVNVNYLQNKDCTTISRYFQQILMMQIAYTPTICTNEEMLVKKCLENDSMKFGCSAVYIRYNPRTFVDTPLALFDSIASFYLAPVLDGKQPSTTLKFKLCLVIPISDYCMLFYGNTAFVNLFLVRFCNPHTFNLYRIVQENKECNLASQNGDYVKFLSTEYRYYVSTKETAYSYSVRSCSNKKTF